MKRFLKVVYCCFCKKRSEAKTFKVLKRHLKSGFYYFPFGKNTIKKADKKLFLPKNILHLHFTFNKNGNLTELEFANGHGKAVLLNGNNAYGYYYNKQGYEMAKNSFMAFYDKFNYPCVSGISFDDNLNLIKMDRINGRVYKDDFHDEIIIKKILECVAEAQTECGDSGEIRFLQHADANRVNVLWREDNDFVFIDLDNIQYCTPMMDVFHYLNAANYTLEKTIELLNKNIRLLEQICVKAKIDINGNFLDELLYGYVRHYKKMGTFYEDFKFLNSKNTKPFPKTNALLGSIKKQ